MYSFSLKICILLLAVSGCGHILVRMAAPTPCIITPTGLICANKTINFSDAGNYLCFESHEIEPILERCTK